ncbi:diguanylate cyclase [Serpentinicella sp. ANB-PHB4]|uniref:GGDEF domain-containing response regulator n=1 Tax=Serpentinicella sp. ANB-PHB4 TaxID=3074076 RepID=UPI00286411B7|nr:diguanylate cyclase [Serpentinicella sp. ANB-PHB4]MDR5659293.1 diguanylate cyclase [Serpentinicella sp. ANB-PHB4]
MNTTNTTKNNTYNSDVHEVFSEILSNLLDFTLYGDVNFLNEIKQQLNTIYKTASGLGIARLTNLCDELISLVDTLDTNFNRNSPMAYDLLLTLSKINKEINETMHYSSRKFHDFPQPTNGDWEKSSWVQEYTNMTYSGTILLVDDDLLLLAILEKIFRKEGYHVLVSSKSTEVLEIIKENAIDIVLLDLIMPEKNGFEVYSEIKSEKPDIAVIFLTANTKMEDKIKALKAGVDGYITKPFQEQEVIANVESILKKGNLQKSVIEDSLTGAYTRKFFKRRFEEERKRFVEKGSHFSIAFLDIDHFKKVNDTFGHIIGDYVLKGFAQEIKDRIRDSDELYRFGGDEFLILFKDTLQEDAYMVLERIREHIENKTFTFDNKDLSINISFSAGISMIQENNDDMETILDKADKALYKSKESGRGQTTLNQSDTKPIGNNKKVLIAEETSIVGNLVKSRLSTLGYHVQFAPDKEKLFGKLEQYNPDLLLFDVSHSDFENKDLLGDILRENDDMKVIISSSKIDDQEINQYLNLGINDFVKKPFSLQDLEQRVRRLLQ